MYYKHGLRVEPEDGIVNNYSGDNESKAPFALSLASFSFRTVNTRCSQAQCIASGLQTMPKSGNLCSLCPILCSGTFLAR